MGTPGLVTSSSPRLLTLLSGNQTSTIQKLTHIIRPSVEEPPITYVRCILIAMAGIIGEVNTKYFRFSQPSGAENKLSALFMILWSQRAYNVFKIAVLPHHKQH